jgi:hypothetical protein
MQCGLAYDPMEDESASVLQWEHPFHEGVFYLPTDNKLWESHRMISPEAREMAISECGDCRFFICIRGVRETRYGCIERIPAYRSLASRVPDVIFVMDLIKMAGRDGLNKILAKGHPGQQACEMWLPRQTSKKSLRFMSQTK